MGRVLHSALPCGILKVSNKTLGDKNHDKTLYHPGRTRPAAAPPGRQALGLLITILVLVGFVTVLRAGVGLVANLFDDTAQKQEYEDKLEGLVLLTPCPLTASRTSTT